MRRQFEYAELTAYGHELIETLNQMGINRWEVVYMNNDEYRWHVVLKRQLGEFGEPFGE